MKQKKIPQRMCLGCGEMKSKKDLIRVVKNKEGEISLDKSGKKAGRGAYICNNAECFNLARKNRRFEKNFSCRIEDSIFEEMERELLEQ